MEVTIDMMPTHRGSSEYVLHRYIYQERGRTHGDYQELQEGVVFFHPFGGELDLRTLFEVLRKRWNI